MATKKHRSIWQRLWTNYVVRSIIWAICLLVIIAIVANIALSVFTRHGSGRIVPDFTGSTVAEAIAVADDNRLKIEIGDSLYMPAYPAGAILDQNPHSGSKVKSGRHVFVTVNTASRRQNRIPYVVGLSLRQAKSAIESSGFEIATLEYVSDVATNNVLAQFINGREIIDDKLKAPVGNAITLRIGRAEGAPAAIMPKLTGLSLAAAKSRLWSEGLNVGRINRSDGVNLLTIQKARVTTQSVTPDSSVELGSAINITIALPE